MFCWMGLLESGDSLMAGFSDFACYWIVLFGLFCCLGLLDGFVVAITLYLCVILSFNYCF